VAGVVIALRGRALSSCRRFFQFELRDPQLKDRFSAVLDRRNEIEGDRTLGWRLTGCFSMLVGALVLVRVLAPVVGYALFCAALAVVMSHLYLSMRNRSVRRAASLTPRTVYSAAPPLCFLGALIAALLPLAISWFDSSARYSGALVACACLAIAVVAARTSQMAALLAGDDPEIEVFVDNRLRWSRVTGLLTLAYGASYVFIAMSSPSLNIDGAILPALNTASSILFVSFVVWALTVYVLGRMRAKTTSA
ncbi:MAG TPA: hypothetical protein VFN49_08185, partial [Candidatus Aquilonibacter sp.]|nr:hypothetical protein [Candidatus Aquilonibacter sp.]